MPRKAEKNQSIVHVLCTRNKVNVSISIRMMNLILYCIVNRKIVTSNQQQCSGQDECQAACHGERRHRVTVTAWSRHADAPLRHLQCHVSRHASRRRNQARLVLIIEMYKGWTVDVDTSTLVLEHRLQKIYQKTKIMGLGW